jgi:serine/threonine protein kinase
LRTFDYGVIEDRLAYVVEEDCGGELLSQYLQHHGPMDAMEVANRGIDLCKGLHAVGREGLLHLAISPYTIWIDDKTCLSGLGITGGDAVFPTAPAFGAPEQFSDQPAAPASDVYSLGHVMWAMLEGQPAIPTSVMQLCREIHLSPHNWELPDDLNAPKSFSRIVEKALDKNASERYGSPTLLGDALEKWLAANSDTVKRIPALQVDERPRRTALPTPGELFDNRYAIERVVGAGGFAKVYRATDRVTGQEVALKVHARYGDERQTKDWEERFIREGRLVFSKLENPHTVRVYDFGSSKDGLLYIAFEYIDGLTLDELIQREGPLEPGRVVHIIRQILHSISEAHSKSILHRDLKPSNVMVRNLAGDPDAVKVLDFGVAKVNSELQGRRERDLTMAGEAVGTPRFMSPEQLRGDPLGPESDIYSIGLIAYELLTGHHAIDGANRYTIVHAQLQSQSTLLPNDLEIPAPLRVIINMMMRKDRERRPASANSLRSELERFEPPSSKDTQSMPAVDPQTTNERTIDVVRPTLDDD